MQPQPDVLPDDPAALKAIILAQREEMARARASALAFEALVQALRIQIAKLRRQRFGPSSERIDRELEQLQLTLEDVEVAIAANDASGEDAGDAQEEPASPRAEPRRRGKPRLRDDAPRERIVLDPGFGFAKTLEHNLVLFGRMHELSALGRPLLVGVSRKSMIGKVLGHEVGGRLYGSLGLAALALTKGAHILRVHDVAETVDVVRMIAAVEAAQ